jgi:hypothetical protein
MKYGGIVSSNGGNDQNVRLGEENVRNTIMKCGNEIIKIKPAVRKYRHQCVLCRLGLMLHRI